MKSLYTAAPSTHDRLRLLSISIGMSAWIILGIRMAWAQPDYAPAHWTPPQCVKYWVNGADALANYGESGPAGKFFCVIHDMEGYYAASVSYLNRCDTNSAGDYNVDASIHYLVNGVRNGPGESNPSDPAAGDITQSVREANYAWHAACWNPYMLGSLCRRCLGGITLTGPLDPVERRVGQLIAEAPIKGAVRLDQLCVRLRHWSRGLSLTVPLYGGLSLSQPGRQTGWLPNIPRESARIQCFEIVRYLLSGTGKCRRNSLPDQCFDHRRHPSRLIHPRKKEPRRRQTRKSRNHEKHIGGTGVGP